MGSLPAATSANGMRLMVVGTPYVSGEYLAKTGGTWHLEDAPFKASQVLKMFTRHDLHPANVCEIGCGAGGILKALREARPDSRFVGYEVSPQAHELCKQFEGEGLEFR